MSKKVTLRAKGGLEVTALKLGDAFEEIAYGKSVKCLVLTTPKITEDEKEEVEEGEEKHFTVTWKGITVKKDGTTDIINYLVHSKYPHYGPYLRSLNKPRLYA